MNTNRLIEFARKTWKLLTVEEQEYYYYDVGTIGFVELVADALHMNISDLSLDEFDKIHEAIFTEPDSIKTIRDELLEHTGENAFGNALFVLFDSLLDAGEDTIATSYGNLGVQITKESMDFVDIASGTSLLTFTKSK